MQTPEQAIRDEFETWWSSEYPDEVTSLVAVNNAFKEVAFTAYLGALGLHVKEDSNGR